MYKVPVILHIFSFECCDSSHLFFCRPILVTRAGPSRCGAQCKTWARGPSEQWCYDVIVFSQACYDRGRTKICSTALTRELSTFANVREEICLFWRERSLLTMKFIWRFYWILKRKVYLAKMNNLPKHHGAGPNAATSVASAEGRPCLLQNLLSTKNYRQPVHFPTYHDMWRHLLWWKRQSKCRISFSQTMVVWPPDYPWYASFL